jgi:hypothetical protein
MQECVITNQHAILIYEPGEIQSIITDTLVTDNIAQPHIFTSSSIQDKQHCPLLQKEKGDSWRIWR